MAHEIAGFKDESDSSRALRKLYVALMLSIAYDSTVCILGAGELQDLSGGRRAVRVPGIPAVRSCFDSPWISIAEAPRILSSIGAASQLIDDAELPPRSALYQIFIANPAEKIG